MNYRLLGRSGLSISEIGFGCMSLGQDDTTNNRLLNEAIDMGINFFDTADLYNNGQNEITVGKALSGRRKSVVLATKVGNQVRPDGKGWDWNPRKDYILGAVDKSLARLQTEYIDLYQLHGGTINDPIDETIEAFELLKQQGKILHYGISSIRPNVIREWIKRSNITSVMMQYSLLDRRPEEECLQLLQHSNIGVLARGSLAKGILVDKPAEPFLDLSTASVQEIKKQMTSAAPGVPATAIALDFVLQNPAISSAVTGIRKEDQLRDIIDSRQYTLSDESYKALTALPALNYQEHR